MTDIQFMPDQAGTFSKTSPFEQKVESSVRFQGGMWFTSGHWAIKTPESGQGKPLMECRPYHTPGYWEKIPKEWKKFDTCAYTPALGRVSGFWCFANTLCARVNDGGNELIAGPAEITSLWKLTHGTDFATELDAVVYLGSKTADDGTFRFFKGPKLRDYVRYTPGKGTDSFEASSEKKIFEVYPRLEEYVNGHKITSVMRKTDFTWFFFNEQVYLYHDSDSSKDRGPGYVKEYIPTLGSEHCDCKE